MPVRDNLQLLKLRRKDGGGRTLTEGLLPDAKPALLPVTLAPLMVSDQLPAASNSVSTGWLTIEFGQVRVRIEGRPDAEMLRLVLTELQRR